MPGKDSREPVWRQGGAGARHPEAAPKWKQKPPAGPTPPTRRRVRRLLFGLSALFSLVILGAVIFWFWLDFREPVAVVLVSGGPGTNLAVPHNAFGVNGLRRVQRDWVDAVPQERAAWLQSLFGSPRVRLLQAPVTLEAKDHRAWQTGLASLGKREKTVLLFLSLHGTTDEQGAYLLLQDFDPTLAKEAAEKHKLRLNAFFEQLKHLKEGALRNKNLVVFLDATQVYSCWPLGTLRNDFAERLEAMDETIRDIPGLVVISASKPGEVSWPCESWQETYFNHFVRVGLQGGARHSHAHKLTAGELFDYVSDKVSSFVAETRGAVQTPVLLPLSGGRERAEEIVVTSALEKRDHADAALHAVIEENSSAWKSIEDAVAKEWDEHAKLAARNTQGPTPFVAAPNVWRECRETLLRWEALLRAGLKPSDAAVVNVKERLDKLMGELRKAHLLDVGDGYVSSLAMPTALGQPPVKGATKDVEEFLNNRNLPEFKEKKLENLVKNLGERPYKAAFRKGIYDHLIARANEGRAKAGELAAELKDIVEVLPPLGRDLPAEWNFAQVVLEHASPNLPPDLLAKGLDTRRLAERAALALAEPDGHPYSETVARLVAPTIKEADQRRRQGEDRLLATNADDHRQAHADLDAAVTKYGAARTAAATLANILETRDRVLDSLLYLTTWKLAQADADLKELRGIWIQAQELTWRASRLESEAKLDELGKLATTLNTSFRRLRNAYATEEARSGEMELLLNGWRSLAPLAAYPTENAEKRRLIIRKLLAVSNRLIAGKIENPNRKPEVSQARLPEAAYEEGRLAETVFLAEPAAADPALKLAIEGLGKELERNTAPAEATPANVTKLGHKVGAAWLKLAQDARARAMEPDAREVERDFATADRLSRLVDGGAAASLVVDKQEWLIPAREWRRLQMQKVFLQQARRLLEDHWVALDGKRHYEIVGRGLIADVKSQNLMPRGLKQLPTAMDEAVNKLKDAYEDPFQIAFDGPGEWTVTDELRLDANSRDARDQKFQYHLAATRTQTKSIPLGNPVVTVAPAPDGPFKATKETPLDSATQPRRQLLGFNGERTGEMTCALDVDAQGPPTTTPGRKDHSVRLQAFYRGRSPKSGNDPLAKDIPLKQLLAPDVVMRSHPQNQPAGIVVRADETLFKNFQQGTGTLVIVLDCSGSMWPDRAKQMTKEEEIKNLRASRFGKAVAVIGHVLKHVPKGTQVSIWTFSQRPRRTEVEESISRFRNEVMTWDPNRADQIVAQLMELRPDDDTPLLRGMREAYRADIEGSTAPGFKTMLVITDGVDNRYAPRPLGGGRTYPGDRTLALGGQFPPLRERIVSLFKKPEAQVPFTPILVGFDVADGELDETKELGKAIVTKLNGHFETVKLGADEDRELSKLRQFLIENLKKELTYKIRPAGSSVFPKDGRLVGRPGIEEWTRLDQPGQYVVSVETEDPDKPERVHVDVRPGELVQLELSGAPGQRTFRRVVFADDQPEVRRRHLMQPVAQSEWWLGVLQNKLKKSKDDQQLDMLVSLEEKDNPPARTTDVRQVNQINPRNHVWFEVESQGGQESKLPSGVSLHWEYVPGYPAPTYRVVLNNWTSESRPHLRLWWLPSQTHALPALTHGLGEGKVLDRLVGRGPANTKAFVKSVRVERQMVQTKANDAKVTPLQCLVVRMHFGSAEPTWVTLAGLDDKNLGAEHRFYLDAGEYVGVFWRESQSTDWDVTGLNFITRSAFVDKAGGLRMDVDKPNLMQPRPADAAPDPPKLQPLQTR